ncbi:MAG TPA: hydantoinase/oxoprolinase family protein, partial [Blastocatellia bacterium]|nr:hydantoinase/oxoprolinase family protein [Blastocatellia bacterium]
MSAKEIRIGIDTGGTFTDFVVAASGRINFFKLPSTPHNPAESIIHGVKRAIAQLAENGDQVSGVRPFPAEIVHGTTVATNALLERKGARTGLITTEGFEDVIEIGRQARPELYNLMVRRGSPLVPRDLRFGVRERTLPDGSILTELDSKGLARIIAKLKRLGVESAAVCLLFSFANPQHEREVASALEPMGVPVSLSHVILPEYREYERTSTTVMNAYLVPLMSRYLMSLAGELGSLARAASSRTAPRSEGAGLSARAGSRSSAASKLLLRVMQSNGGSVSAEAAATEPGRAILSGPAGGVVGALQVCERAGFRDIITFDMGGTSTDVALCRGGARTTNEAIVAGLPVAIPIIDIHTVGAGGGSIARVDDAGAL